jgi:hypothetical protein
LERNGQVLRNEGRWVIGTTSLTHMSEHVLRAGNRKS